MAEKRNFLKVEHEVKTTTLYFIRHAEKDSSNPLEKDPALSEAGLQRVEEWIKIFAETPLEVVYTTPYRRTRQTAELIAASKKIPVKLYHPRNLNDADFQSNTAGKCVLVVGHSNTNPVLVNILIGENKYPELDENQYGSLYTVTVYSSGEKSSEVKFF